MLVKTSHVTDNQAKFGQYFEVFIKNRIDHVLVKNIKITQH